MKRPRIIGPSKHVSKANPLGNRRTQPARPSGSVARPRWKHKKDFRSLSDYLLEGDKQKDGEREFKDGEGRVGTAYQMNTGVAQDYEQLSPDQVRDVGQWMGNTAGLNKRAVKSAVVHYVISLPNEDKNRATPEFWREIGPRVLEAVEMPEHEALFIEHVETNNPHLHIMINRVHPTKETVKDTLRDLIKLEKLNRKRMNSLETKKFKAELKVKLSDKPFSKAENWGALEDRLTKDNLHLFAEGRGLKIADQEGREIKLSSVAGKGKGRSYLEKKFEQSFNDFLETKNLGISQQELNKRRSDKAEKEQDKSRQDGKEALSNFVEFLSSHEKSKKFRTLTKDFNKADFIKLHAEVTKISEKNKDPIVWRADIDKRELYMNAEYVKTAIESILKKRFDLDINTPVSEPKPEPEPQPEIIVPKSKPTPKPDVNDFSIPMGAELMPDPKVLPDISEDPKKISKPDVLNTPADLPEKAPKVVLRQSGQAGERRPSSNGRRQS